MSILSAGAMGAQEGDDGSMSVRWRVVTDGTETTEDVLNSSLIPQPGERYAIGTGSKLTVLPSRNASVEDPDERTQWIVTIPYGLRDTNASSSIIKGDAHRLQGYSTATRSYDVVAEEGYLGAATTKTPVQNSATDPFDPPPMMSLRNQVMTFTQSEGASFDPDRALDHENTINSADIKVAGRLIAAGKGLMVRIQPRLDQDGTYSCQYEIEIAKARGFAQRLLDQGYRYLSGGRPREIKMSDINSTDYGASGALVADNKPVSDPVKLDGSGGILGTGSGANPVYREYRFVEYADWNSVLDLVRNRP